MEKDFEDLLKNNIKKMYNEGNFVETHSSYNIDCKVAIDETVKDFINKFINEENGYDNFVRSRKYKLSINTLVSYGLGLTIKYWGVRLGYEKNYILEHKGNENYKLLIDKIKKEFDFLFEETYNQEREMIKQGWEQWKQLK